MVRREVAPGDDLQVGEDELRARVVELPFA